MTASSRDLFARAESALRRDDRDAFIAVAHTLIDQRAALGSQWGAIGQVLLQFGEVGAAARAMALHVRAANYAPAACYDQALLLAQAGRVGEATRALAKAGRTVPDRASNAYLRGTLALNAGDTDDAADHLTAALDALPTSGQIMQTLSSLGSMATLAGIGDRIAAAAPAMAAGPVGEQGVYLYALGKVHHDRGEHDAAFRAFARGAAIIAAQRRYDPTADRDAADAATRGWTAERMAAIGSRVGRSTARPIIVTGSPRSGSTLVEQILASHSAVAGGEEMGSFAQVVHRVGGADHAAAERWLGDRGAGAATDLYLHLADERFGREGRFVDKTLDASRYLGLLAATLPEAPIVWTRRDPLDTAWSCFRTYFLRGLEWSWSLPAIAAHFRLEDRLLAHWQALLGGRLMVVRYEELVRDKAAVIPAILAHCGLEMEDATLTPEATRRLVVTNSVAQVREPITTRAIDSARPYLGHLRPFIDAYQAT